MSQISPFINQRTGRQNQPVIVPTEPLLVDPPAITYLATDIVSGSSTLPVQNISNFSINQIILIGDLGNQNSEIIKTSNGTPPSGSTITLASNTVFAHTASTPVTVLYYDNVQFWVGSTSNTPVTLLGSQNIVANTTSTDYNDLAANTGYYFARFHNTIGSTNSVYSAASPVAGYGLFSARNIIDNALGMINKQISSVLTDEYGFQQIDSCQMECLKEFKRWSFMQKFDTIIGQTQEGTWKIQVPMDLDDQVTYRSIYNFRIGKESQMVWIDKAEWDTLIEGIAYSTLAVQANISDTTLTLSSSNDFDTQGTIQVGSNQYTWTNNNTSTGVLTLGSPVLAVAPIGQDVFQFSDLGLPVYWTIWQGFIYHWPICSSVYSGRNYWLDYYSTLVPITNDYQSIILPDPSVVQYYLAWKFLLKLNNGEETPGSTAHYNNFILRKNLMKTKESLNRNFVFSPDFGGGGYGGGYQGGGYG